MDKFPRVHRLPPYVFAKVNELKMQMRHEGEDIIDLGMGNPDLPTPQHIVARQPSLQRVKGNQGTPQGNGALVQKKIWR